MINSCDSMRMSTIYKAIHSFFEIAIYNLWRVLLMFECYWIGFLKFASISFKFKIILRITFKFNGSPINRSTLILYRTIIKKISERDLFDRLHLNIGDERKDGSATNFRYIFIIFGGFKKIIAMAGWVAMVVGAVWSYGVRILLVTPIGVIWFIEEIAHVLSIPSISIAASGWFLWKKASPFGNGCIFSKILLAIILISTHELK